MALKSADIPTLLFPLRLETRFVGSELWIRALPDEAFMQSHDPRLTKQERKHTLDFREILQVGYASNEIKEIAKKEKWQELVSNYGAYRASYLVHLAQKNNLEQIKDIGLINEEEEQEFYFKGMPERLVAYLYPTDSDEIITVAGREIADRDKLVVFGEGDEWVTTFDAPNDTDGIDTATDAGVGIIVRAEDLKDYTSFDRIIVVGFYYRNEDEQNDEKSVVALTELFENHLYTEGISFLEYGTSTNNLGKEKSGHSIKTEFDAERTYEYLVNGQQLNETPNADASNNNPVAGATLATALGMNVNTFQHFGQTQLQASNINKVFKKISWFSLGKQTLRMLYKDDISNEAHEFLWEHFEEYVDARGPLSTLKIGDQPYAILPVTSIQSIHTESNVDKILGSNDYFSKTSLFLSMLFEEWKKMSQQTNIPNVNATQDIHKELLKIMSMQEYSTSYQLSVLEYDRFRGQLATWLQEAADVPANLANLPIGLVYELLKDRSEINGILRPNLENYQQLKQVLSKEFIKNEEILDYINTEKDLSHAELLSFKYHKTYKINTPLEKRNTNLEYLDLALIPEITDDFDELAALKDVFNQVLTTPDTNDKRKYDTTRESLLQYKGKRISLFSDLLLRGYTNAVQLYHRNVYFQPSIENLTLFKGAKKLYVQAVNSDAEMGQAVITLWDGLNRNRTLEIKKPFNGEIKKDSLYVSINQTVEAGQRLFRIQDEIKETKVAEEIALLSLEMIEDIENLEGEARTTALYSALREAIDLNSYRLDAWITSLATCRLKSQRAATPKGIYFGAYGWVEGLKKDIERLVDKGNMRDESRDDDGGIIHCPTPAQALTATIFKNSFLSYKDVDLATNPFTLNLTSDRIQKSENFMDGIRQDQKIEVLLGYQLERALHDSGKNVELYDLRAVFPTEVNQSVSELGNPSTTTQLGVIDGLKFLRASQFEEEIDISNFSDEQIIEKRKAKLVAEIEKSKRYNNVRIDFSPVELVNRTFPFLLKLEDTLDGSLDTLFFEAGYQLVNGNLTQSAAALDATKGLIEPPEQESLKTPISGTGIQHQLSMIFPSAPPIEEVKKGKAFAAPILHNWLVEQLGSLSEITCLVELYRGEEKLENKTQTIKLSELGINHSDFLYLSNQPVLDGAGELEVRIWNQYIKIHGSQAEDVRYKIVTQEKPVTLGDALEFAKYTFRLLSQSRSLKSEDLRMNEEEARYDWDALHKIKTERLDKMVSALTLKETDIIKSADWLVQYDLVAAKSAYLKQEPPILKDLKKELDAKLKKANVELIRYTEGYQAYQKYKKGELEYPPDYYVLFNHLLKAAKALLGPEFIMLPPAIATDKYTQVANTNQQEKLIGNSELENQFFWGADRIQTWIQGLAQVQKGAACLEEWQMIQQVWSEKQHKTPMQFSIIQGPTLTQQPWIGLSKEEINALLVSKIYAGSGINAANINHYPKGSESMVVLSEKPLSFANYSPQYGIVITEFTEHIPDEKVTTGLSFHYNAPNNEAPQALLLAVAPPRELRDIDDWLETGLRDIVYDTMDLAKIRLVDLDAMQKYGFVLPMTYWFNIPTVN